MNRAQHIILILYCFLLLYCSLWVPWHVQRGSRFASTYVRSGYGWLWNGPKQYCPPPPSEHTANLCNIDDGKPEYDPDADPDRELLALRYSAATAIGVAAFLLAGIHAKSATWSSK
jgi:hypothetical protein